MQVINRNAKDFKALELKLSMEEHEYLSALDALKAPVSFLYDKEHGAFLPFCINNKHKLFKQVYTPWFVQEFKPLGYTRAAFLKASAAYFKKYYGKVNLRIPAKDAQIFKQVGFTLTERTTYRLQYINLTLSSNHKRSIKKAKEQNLLVQTIAVYELTEFLSENLFTRIPDFNGEQIENFTHFITKLEGSNQLITLGVRGRINEILAAAVFYKEGKIWHYLKGSASEEGRSVGAMHLIFLSFLEGLNSDEILDFNGSDIAGVAKFYEGFGATRYHYSEINYLKYPRLTTLILKLKSYV